MTYLHTGILIVCGWAGLQKWNGFAGRGWLISLVVSQEMAGGQVVMVVMDGMVAVVALS